MKKKLFRIIVVLALTTALMAFVGGVLAGGETGFKGGNPDSTPPVLDPADLMEGFEDITNLPDWFMQNNSDPLGTTDWFQGNDGVFPAHAGSPASYIGANFNNTAGGNGTISNWLLTPVLNLNDGDIISFWTRSPDGSIWADRLELRMSTNGASTDVGTLATDVGDFTTVLTTVNPNLEPSGYPQVWTEFSVTISGVGDTPVDGRLGFRYFVTDAGPSGINSNYIGIDTVTFTDIVVIEPSLVMTKTVGTDPAVCATTDEITVVEGADVYYCYQMENTGNVTLTYHTVTDSELGVLLGPDFVANVGPGSVVYFTETTSIMMTTVNTATWDVRDDQGGSIIASDSDTATVTTREPTDVSLSGFGSEAAAVTWPAVALALVVLFFGAALIWRRQIDT